MRKSVWISLIGVVASIAAVIGVSSSAQADALTPAACNGKTYDYTLDEFTNPGAANLPLRCGNASFGLNHMIKRGHLTATTAHMIQLTLTYGELQPDSKGVKQLFDGACDALYTVIYGYNAYNGSDPKANPIGVVNAYDNTIVTASTTAATSTSETASYRTDCPVFEPIHD